MKHRWVALLLVLLLPLLSGCWDRVEVNDVAIVDLVGIDKAPKGLRLTISVIIPTRATGAGDGGKGGGGDGPPAITYTAEGESIMNAMSKIQTSLSRRLFWAHARVLVIGEEFARAGVRPAMDFWSRHREPRLLMQIAVTPGKAGEYISAKPRLERLLSEAVRESLNMRMQASVTLTEFLSALRSESEEAIAPRVSLEKRPDGKDAVISGTALFRDDKLIGWLDAAETRSLLWLRDEIRTGVATVDLPSGGRVSMMLIRGDTNLRPVFQNGRPRMIVEMDVEDDVYETSAPIDLGKRETVELLQKLLAKDLEHRVREVLTKLQKEYGVDSIKFADVMRRRAPLRWENGLKKQWPQLFRDLPVDLKVTAHVRRTGEHSSPLTLPENRVKKSPSELMKTQGGSE